MTEEEQRLAWFMHRLAHIWMQTEDAFFLCYSHIQEWPWKKVQFPNSQSFDFTNSGQLACLQ